MTKYLTVKALKIIQNYCFKPIISKTTEIVKEIAFKVKNIEH